jgi:Gamma-glutamyl cyclotransferase, AIG2-like
VIEYPLMTLKDMTTENLFSYGTLQLEAVQLSTFRRRLQGEPDMLVGYRMTSIPISDLDPPLDGATHHRNIQFTGIHSDLVEGTVFKVSREELQRADAYEPADYERVGVRLKSGLDAWVYLSLRQ